MSLLSFLLLTLVLVQLARWWGTHKVLAFGDRHVGRTRFRQDLESEGAAEPGEQVVVMLHGTFCDAHTLDLWRAALEAEGYPCWLFEYRYLDSVVRNARLFEQAMSERLEALGEGAPRRILLLGYSQGGMILRWILSGEGSARWLGRVVGLVQVASPNGGCEPSDLERVLWRRDRGESPTPALEQMRPESRFLEGLAARSLRTGLRYGVVYGHGPGSAVLGRFMAGHPRGTPWTRLLGWFYQLLFLCPRENDGLVSTESALLLHASPGLEDEPAPIRVENDHLGLLEDPEAARAVTRLAGDFLGGRGSGSRLA